MKISEYKEMRALQKRFECFDTSDLFQIAKDKVSWYEKRFLGVLHHRIIDIENELYEHGFTQEEAQSTSRHRIALNMYNRAIQEYEFYSEQLQSLKRLHELQRKHDNEKQLFDMRKGNVSISYPHTGEQLELF